MSEIERVVIPVVEGDTWEWDNEVVDETGAPWSFAGLTVHMDLRRDIDGQVFAQLTSANGGLTLDSPSPGWIAVRVPSNLTRGLLRKGMRVLSIETEIETRDGANPSRVQSIVPLRIDVSREGTRNG